MGELSDPNVPEPGIKFRYDGSGCINGQARLDWLTEGGLRVDFHEGWQRDEYRMTISKEGLRVGLTCSLFHLGNLKQALGYYIERVKQRPRPQAEPAQGGVTRFASEEEEQ